LASHGMAVAHDKRRGLGGYYFMAGQARYKILLVVLLILTFAKRPAEPACEC
jgi:hypothetical protein